MNEEKLSKLLADGYILAGNKGKIEIVERPAFGSIEIKVNDGLITYIDTVTKEKFN